MTPRGGGVEISFIFFIDIIMAVTGVMLFVIILLVLDLDPNSAVSKSRAAKAAHVEPTETKATQPKPVTEPHRNDDAVKSEIKTLKEQVDQRQAELSKLKDQISDAESRAKKTSTETEKLTKVAGQKFKPVELILADAAASQRKAVLLECSQNTIMLQPWNEEVRPVICAGDNPEARRKTALQALATYPKDKFAIVLIVKPSAFAWSPDFLTELREGGYSAGTEPMEEDHTAIKW